MKKTCDNCVWLEEYEGKYYYCARHLDDYFEKSDIACSDWRYVEQEDEHDGN